MGTITLLQLQKRRKDRVSVFIDHEYAFSVALDIAASLRRGQDLAPDDIARIRTEDDYRRALDRALHFLSFRPRSRTEVARHLSGKDVPETTIQRVLERLSALDLVDDAAFAQWWVDNRLRHQPRGARALRSELAVRGVPSDVINEAVAGLDEAPLALELALARARRHASLPREAFDRRLGGYLQRRGFSHDAVRAALGEAWAHCHPDTEP